MAPKSSSPHTLQFDPYTLDLENEELRKDEKLAKLQSQPLKLLALLATHSGRVVTREQIQEKLWSNQTFVDFDKGIYHCVKEIRRCLGDDANSPRYVETVPGKGYRFIAPVKIGPAHFSSEPDSTRSRHVTWTLLLAATAILALAVAAYLLFGPDRDKDDLIQGTFTQLTSHAGREYFPSLSPDGHFVVYAGEATGNWDIYLKRVGGEDAINLTKDSGADDTQPSFSPDGELIAFRSERDGGGIFIMGATGASVRRLTDFGHNPSWAPDGESVLCETAGVRGPGDVTAAAVGEVWRVDASSGKKRLVIRGTVRQPCLSPHGHRMAYWFSNHGRRDIWTMLAEGGEPVAVTDDSDTDWNPIWSPDGNYLYFASDRDGHQNLWRVRIDEETGAVLEEPEKVTAGVVARTYHPTMSMDGRRIAYSAVVNLRNIHKVHFDPEAESVMGEPTAVTSRGGFSPCISPDGEWIAFTLDFGLMTTQSIVIIRTNGSDRRQLTRGRYRDMYPTWSPDGKRVTFQANRSGTMGIWLINTDGSGLEQLTGDPPLHSLGPVWSPDGAKIAFWSRTEGQTYTIDPTQLKEVRSAQPLPPHSQGFMASSWSLDGRFLAGETIKQEGIEIYSFESGTYQRLADFGGNPIWLSDSRRLLFSRYPSGETPILLLDSETGKHHEVLSPEILDIAPDKVGPWVSISPDDETIYFSRRSREADIWLLTLGARK